MSLSMTMQKEVLNSAPCCPSSGSSAVASPGSCWPSKRLGMTASGRWQPPVLPATGWGTVNAIHKVHQFSGTCVYRRGSTFSELTHQFLSEEARTRGQVPGIASQRGSTLEPSPATHPVPPSLAEGIHVLFYQLGSSGIHNF